MKNRPHLTPTQTAKRLTTRGEVAKPLIESRSGPSISSAQASVRIGVSDETIRNMVKAGRLIGYSYRDESKVRLRLPEWQFLGPTAVCPWVEPLIKAYGGNGWALIDFLTVPRRGTIADSLFSGESLLQRLQSGDIQTVLKAAQRANAP